MIWKDVQEHEPAFGEKVIVCDAISKFVGIGIFYYDENQEEVIKIMAMEDIPIDFVVSHWMHMPEPENYLEQ